MGCTTGAASGIIKRQSVSGQRIDRSKKQKQEPVSVLLLFSINEKDRTALAARFVRYGEASRPDAERHAYYQKQYQLYKDLREFEVRHVKG